MAWRSIESRVLTHPRYSRKTIIVGNGEGASELASILQQQPSSAGREYLGLLELPSIGDTRTFTETEALQRLVCMADSGAVDDIVVAFGDNGRAAQPVLDALVACWRAGAEVIPLEEYYEIALSYVPVHLIGPNIFALLTPDSDMGRRLWQALRRAADVTVATIGLVCFAGVLPLLALAIWLDSPGPIFYRQQRVGLADRVFSIAKLRSMVSDAESSGGAQWATPNDRRVTRVGRWLRKSRLDELPQLWNVLVGDMSLIGPRPERPEFVARLTETLPYYDIRHAIRPGLTGWAQVRYRYGSSEADALIKLQYDLYYLKHRGPLLDALIALHTLRTIVRLEGQ